MLEEIKAKVYQANMMLPKHKLVTLTWGNASQLDRESGCFVIKPSGVTYENLRTADMVVVNLAGEVVEGKLKPSSDTATHAELYRSWPEIGGIVHTHSPWAVSFAQAGLAIPAAGTTHADAFFGAIPVSAGLRADQVADEYERNTGKVIVQTFLEQGLEPLAVPGILVNDHGPFTWGTSAEEAVKNSVTLESVAEMTYHSLQLNPHGITIPQYLLDKHYYRKHGASAYYGQK